MQLESKKCLYDIRQTADLLAQCLAGKPFAAFQNGSMSDNGHPLPLPPKILVFIQIGGICAQVVGLLRLQA